VVFHAIPINLHVTEHRSLVVEILQHMALDTQEACRDVRCHDQAITFHQLAGVCMSRQGHRPVGRVLLLGVYPTDHILRSLQKLDDLMRWPAEVVIQKEQIGRAGRVKKLRNHLAASLGNERIAATLRPSSRKPSPLAGRVSG